MLPTSAVQSGVQRQRSALPTHVLHATIQILFAETILDILEDQGQGSVKLSPDLLEVCFAVPLCVCLQILDDQFLRSSGGVDAASALRSRQRSVDSTWLRRGGRRARGEIDSGVAGLAGGREIVHFVWAQLPT